MASSTTLYDGDTVTIGGVNERVTEVGTPVHSGSLALRIETTPTNNPFFNLAAGRVNFAFPWDVLTGWIRSNTLTVSTLNLQLKDFGTFVSETVNLVDYLSGDITSTYKQFSIPKADLINANFDLTHTLTLLFGTNADSEFFYVDDLQLEWTVASDVTAYRMLKDDHIELTLTKQPDTTDIVAGNFSLSSATDPNYTTPQNPSNAYYHWRSTGFDVDGHQLGVTMVYYIILALPHALTATDSYTLTWTGVNDDAALSLTGTPLAVAFDPTQVNESIKVNQVGYRPTAEKVGIVGAWRGTGGGVPYTANVFTVHRVSDGVSVFSGTPTQQALADDFSGEDVYWCDFTSLQTPGDYYAALPEFGRSHAFTIGATVFNAVAQATAKSLYYQRCGVALLDAHVPSSYARTICHDTEDAFYHSNLGDAEVSDLYNDEDYATPSARDTAGGWHDAGDYNKYIPNAAPALYRGMLAFELYPEKFIGTSWDLPESGNGLPDLLNELKWELDWFLTMQYTDNAAKPGYGGVYHKVSSTSFADDTEMPHLETHNRHICYITTGCTAQFAAIMAQAARVYAPYDAAFATTCQTAAELAWTFLETWISPIPSDGNYLPSGISTGSYSNTLGTNSDEDERAWAAAELYKLTGDTDYQTDYITYRNATNLMGTDNKLGNFRDSQPFASMTFSTITHGSVNTTEKTNAHNAVVAAADDWIARFDASDYRTPVQHVETFIGFGSYAIPSSRAFQLIAAYYLTDDSNYLTYAEKFLDTQLGLNPLGKCFITGLGSAPSVSPLNFYVKNSSLGTPPGYPINGPMHHPSGANAHNAALIAAYNPAESSQPVFRRYVDTYLSPEYSEATVDDYLATAVVYAFFTGLPESADHSAQHLTTFTG